MNFGAFTGTSYFPFNVPPAVGAIVFEVKMEYAILRSSVAADQTDLNLANQHILAISDGLGRATQLERLVLTQNDLTAVPKCVFLLGALRVLHLNSNHIVELPPAIALLPELTILWLHNNLLLSLPREIALLSALVAIDVSNNRLAVLPAELGSMPTLTHVNAHSNLLSWVPVELDRLRPTATLYLHGNRLPLSLQFENVRSKLEDIFAATTKIAMIRWRATDVCVGLQDLELPALVTLEIVDTLLVNSIRMWAKWELITAVKHFHQRHY
jgi:Leucine-rich repeat (LRR) protein